MGGDGVGNAAESTKALAREGGPLGFRMRAAQGDLPTGAAEDFQNDEGVAGVVAFSEVGDGGTGLWKVIEQAAGDAFAGAIHQFTGINSAFESGFLDGAHFFGSYMTHAMRLRKKRHQVEWCRFSGKARPYSKSR